MVNSTKPMVERDLYNANTDQSISEHNQDDDVLRPQGVVVGQVGHECHSVTDHTPPLPSRWLKGSSY